MRLFFSFLLIVLLTAQPVLAQSAGGAGGGIALDLTSQSQSITVTANMLAAPTNITVGGVTKTVSVGTQLTPGEFAALQQVLNSGSQSVMLDLAGRAVAGRVDLSALSARLSALIIPSNVTAFNSGANSALNIAGPLTTAGALIGAISGSNFNVNAASIVVASGGTISTIIPAMLQSVLTSAAAHHIDLSLNSLSDIVNAGTISASGDVNLFAGSGKITNTGVIQSIAGSVNLNTVNTKDLIIKNIGGHILADLGHINLRDSTFTAKNLTQVIGGEATAQTFNVAGGDGHVQMSMERLNAALNIKGGTADVFVNGGTLHLASMELSGDPTIANAGGSVLLQGNQDLGQTLRFTGQNLAILASGDIVGDTALTLVDLSSPSGSGGNLLIIAGYDFVNLGAGVYQMQGPSPTGGNVSLPNVHLHTSAPGHSGNVTILARENISGPGGGNIDIKSVDTTSAGGTGGDILIIGESSIHVRGQVDTTGAAAGSVDIAGAIPDLPVTAKVINSALNVSPEAKEHLLPHAPIPIKFDKSIVAMGSENGNVNVLTSGDILFDPLVNINAGGQIFLGTSGGGIDMSGANNFVAQGGAGIVMLAGGTPAGIHLGLGSNLIANNDIVLVSGTGGIAMDGGNTVLANHASVVLLSEGNINTGNGSGLFANDALFLATNSGFIQVDSGSTLIGLGSIALLGTDGVNIDSGCTVVSGLLETGTPADGVLQFNDIDRFGFILLAAESGINVNSDLTVNGGDLAILADGGVLSLGIGTRYVANGGYITMFSTDAIQGGSNFFHSRAVGNPDFFFGGLIQLSAGFSFNPDIISFYQGESGAKTAVGSLHSKILKAADEISSYVNSDNPLYLVPETDDSNIILDTALIGSNVIIEDESFGPALLHAVKVGAGQVDASGSTVTLKRGAIFLESVGAGSLVFLPGSEFKTESYGIAPTGFFKNIRQVVANAISPLPADSPFPDPTILPTDQNQVRGRLMRDGLRPQNERQTFPGKGNGKDRDKNKEEEEHQRQITSEFVGPIVDTADAESGSTHFRYTNLDTRQGLGPGQMSQVQLAETEVLPMYKVSEKFSNLMMFTSANQVLAGNFGNSSDAVAVGSKGTAISANRDVVVLHSGRIMADSGKGAMTITTKLATVKLPADSTAIVINTPGKPLRVLSVGGDAQAPIEVVSRGGSAMETLKVAPGEELVVADVDLADEDLIPVDGLDRSIVSGGITKAGPAGSMRSMKSKVSLKQVIEKEPLISGRSIRLGGGRRGAGYNRVAQRIAQTAKQQNPSVNVSKFFHTGGNGKDSGEPVQVLAEDGTLFRQVKDGQFELKSGTLFIDAPQNTMVQTAMGVVHASKDSRISVELSKGRLRVQSCSGPGSVFLQSGDDKITLAPGREVLLTDKSITPEDAIADDGIGRRRLAAYKLHNQKFAVVDDFAIVSLVNSARHLRPLREPITATDVQLREKMVKMAAAVEYTSMNRGRYTVRQKETACR